LTVVTVLAFAAMAFVAGAMIAARCCVPAGSGLAGAGIVVGYGILAAGGGALAGLLFGLRLPPRALVILSCVSALVGVPLLGLGLAGYLRSQAELDAHLAEAHERMNPYRVRLRYADTASRPPFTEAIFDWGARRVEGVAGGQACTWPLAGTDAARMLEALRAVEGVMLEDPFPCAGTLGAVARELEMVIPEHTPPDTRVRLAITEACLALHPALAGPFDTAGRLLAAGPCE
jgi:hypothetical protein